MIVRHYIKCLTCGAPYTTRISIGHRQHQEHIFNCRNCEESICLGVNIDFEKVVYDIKCISNCCNGDDEGIVVNLHPEILIDKELANEDSVFPGMMESMRLIDKHSLAKDQKNTDVNIKYHDILKDWPFIKQAWSLFINEKYNLLDEKLKAFYNNQGETSHDFLQHFYDFVKRLLGKKGQRNFLQISIYIEKTKKDHPEEYMKFMNHTFQSLDLRHFAQYLEIFDEYFRAYDEFAQASFHLMLDEDVPDTLIATSAQFRKSRMFYGNAYELFSSNVELLATLNNVAKGRSFDQFETMDLAKYRTIDKANRCQPFRDETELYSICNCMDSRLRNASHHGSMRYEHKTHQVLYRAGNPPKEFTISYAQYLGKCVDMMIAVTTLLMVELGFMYAKYRRNLSSS